MINQILYGLFYLLTVLYIFFVSYEQSIEQNNYSFLLVLALGFFVYKLGSICNRSNHNADQHKNEQTIGDSHQFILLSIILLGCVLRLYSCNKHCAEPLSDFKDFYDAIILFSRGECIYTKGLGYVIPYAYLLRYMHEGIFPIQLINIFVYAISSLFAYWLCSKVFMSKASGLLAAFFISIYPPFVFYSEIVASEHIWFMYLTIVFFLEFILLEGMDDSSSWKKRVSIAFFLGFLIQLTALTRGNSSILLPIIIFMLVFANMKALRKVSLVVLAICLGFLTPKIYIKYLEQSSGISLISDKPTSVVLVIGTNVETHGICDSDYPKQLRERVTEKYGKDVDSWLPTAIEFVFDKWKNNTVQQFQLACEKISLVAGERSHQKWVFLWHKKAEDGKLISTVSKQDIEQCKTLSPIYQSLYSIFSLFLLFIIMVLGKSRQLVLYSIILFLVACLLLQGIHEYQPRYSLIYFWGLSILGSAVGVRSIPGIDKLCIQKAVSFATLKFWKKP